MNLTPVTHRLQQQLDPLAARLFAPRLLGRVAALVPFVFNRRVVEQLANRVFTEQIAEGDFEFLSGRRLQIHIIDTRLHIGLSYQDDRIICYHFADREEQAEATLSVETLDAIRLIRQQVDPDTLFFQRRLKINGDTELAHQVKNTIDTLNPEIIPGFIRSMLAQYQSRVLPMTAEE